MNESLHTPADTNPEAKSSGFKGFKQAQTSLRTMQTPISPETRDDYLSRIRDSPTARYIAFRLLALRALGDLQTKLGPFLQGLDSILHENELPLDLRGCDTMEGVQQLVSKRFSTLQTKDDWRRFFATGLHLPILYGLIRTWDDPLRFHAGVEAIANATARSKRRKISKNVANNSEVIARIILGRVPEKPGLGKALPELFTILQATWQEAEEINRENLRLEMAICNANTENQELGEKLTDETAKRMKTETDNRTLESLLSELGATVKEERQHFETMKAHNSEEKSKAIQDAVARTRSEVLRRLENIRLFADREPPNRGGILSLVREIENTLNITKG